MASTEALRPQNPCRNRPESSRKTKNDVSLRVVPASKSCELPSGGLLSEPRDENRDPNARAKGTKAVEKGRRAGVSKLPVPVKSQRLGKKPDTLLCQTQKTLGEASKVKVQKESCAKTVPFSLSQTRATGTAGSNRKETPMSVKLETLPSAPLPARCPGKLPSHKLLRSGQCPTVAAASDPASVACSMRVGTAVSEPALQLLESAHVTTPRPAYRSSQEVPRGEAGLVPSTQIKPTASSDASSRHIAGSTIPFCPDSSALHSILQNEGIKTGVPPNMPQRVSVLRSQHGAGAKAGNMLQFSPDAAALLSILQNKGIQTRESPAATPHTSVYPTVRGSSVYLPQRIPVTKSCTELVGVFAECSQSPAVRWTPQRVPNTRPQSMRRLLSSHRTPFFRNTPKIEGVQSCSQELEALKEEKVVQRLFEDAEQEDEPSPSLGLNGQPKAKDTPNNGLPEQQIVPSAVLTTDGGNGEKDSQQPKFQPFVQAAHRGSVIVFAQTKTKKALSTPSAEERPGVSQDKLEPCTWKQASAEVMEEQQQNRHFLQAFPWESLRATGAGISRPIHSTASVTSVLRHRLQPLAEVLLDEECTMYASRQPSSAAQLDRCGNPVASTLDFRDSTCFVPIVLPPLLPLSPSMSDSDSTVSAFNFITDTPGQDLKVQ